MQTLLEDWIMMGKFGYLHIHIHVLLLWILSQLLFTFGYPTITFKINRKLKRVAVKMIVIEGRVFAIYRPSYHYDV